MASRSKFLSFGVPLLGLISLTGGAVVVSEEVPDRPNEVPPRAPANAPVLEGEGASFIGAIGVSEPYREPIVIAPHLEGVVSDVAVEVGQIVKKGDILITVDTRRAEQDVRVARTRVHVATAELRSRQADIPSAEARLRAAEAAVSSAEAELEASVAEESSAQSEKASAEAEVTSAEVNLLNRQNLLQVAESVTDQRSIAAEEVDRRRFAAASAEASVAQANASVQRALAGIARSRARIDVATARVEEAEAALLTARTDLERLVDPSSSGLGPDLLALKARIDEAKAQLAAAVVERDLLIVTSPHDATVLQIGVREGEFASTRTNGQGVITLGRRGPAQLRVAIDEVDVSRFSKSARAWASPRGQAEMRYELELDLVEPFLVAKSNLAGRTSELIDTRVLEVVYNLPPGFEAMGLGQQFDVYIEEIASEDQ